MTLYTELFFKLAYFIEMYLIYNVVLVSGVQQSDSVIQHIYLFFSRFFSLIGYCKMLTLGPCAIQ